VDEYNSDVDDFDIPLVNFKQSKDADRSVKDLTISSLLLIFDVKCLIKIVSVLKSFESMTHYI
jgi:hypothetical protein